jgi:hypothetical protein
MDHSVLTKSLHKEAQEAGVPCITTAGIYPGMGLRVFHCATVSAAQHVFTWQLTCGHVQGYPV